MKKSMKCALTLAVLSLSPSLWASAQCPQGSKTLKSCVSTPQPGDDSFATELGESIAICNANGVVSMVLADKEGQSNEAVAQVESRMGGTTYSFEQDGVRLSLSVTEGTQKPNPKAKFTVTFTEATPPAFASTTYTCK